MASSRVFDEGDNLGNVLENDRVWEGVEGSVVY